MRFLEFNESTEIPAYTTLPINSPEEFADYVKKNCSNFLAQAGKRKLYRSVNWYSDRVLLMQSPINRTPRDMSKNRQTMVDQVLTKRGFTALRTNSIFCSGAPEVTRYYGDDLFVVYPLNGFSYTWSPDIPDMATVGEGLEINTESDRYFLSRIEDADFWDTHIGKALADGIEIYIHGKYVFAADDKWGHIKC